MWEDLLMENVDRRVSSGRRFNFWRFEGINVFLSLSCNESLEFSLSNCWDLILVVWELLNFTYLRWNLRQRHFELFKITKVRLAIDPRSTYHRIRLSLSFYILFRLRDFIGKVEFFHEWPTLRWYCCLSFGLYLNTIAHTDTRMLAKSKLLCGIWTPWKVIVH